MTGYVIVNEGVGEIRAQPDHAAEQGSQAVLGTPLKVLGRRDGDRWLRVEGMDGYRGWMRSWSVHPVRAKDLAAYQNGPQVEVDSMVARVRARASGRSDVRREATLGVKLRRVGRSGNWVRVELPDGERGYLHARDLLVDRTTLRARHRPKDIPSVVRTARRFLGVPYQWGGTTPKGLDCSGLTQTSFRLHGILLPRDSKDQFKWAKRETFVSRDPQGPQFGHLIFFGETDARVNHVAISLGDGKFLHSRGRVRINSLRPEDPDFDRDLFRLFRGSSPVLLS